MAINLTGYVFNCHEFYRAVILMIVNSNTFSFFNGNELNGAVLSLMSFNMVMNLVQQVIKISLN